MKLWEELKHFASKGSFDSYQPPVDTFAEKLLSLNIPRVVLDKEAVRQVLRQTITMLSPKVKSDEFRIMMLRKLCLWKKSIYGEIILENDSAIGKELLETLLVLLNVSQDTLLFEFAVVASIALLENLPQIQVRRCTKFVR